MGSTRPILKSRIISENNKTVELLVDRSRCVRTLASLASLEGRHLARCVQEQHQTCEEETVVHSVHVEYRELRKGITETITTRGLYLGTICRQLTLLTWSPLLYHLPPHE